MKFSRVSKVLPVGAIICSDTDTDWPSVAKELFGGFVNTSKRIESNQILTLTLEVPDGSEKATAAALREMADELEGKK